MHRYTRRAFLVSVVLLEYLVAAGLVIAATVWSIRTLDPSDYEGPAWLGLFGFLLVTGVVAPGFGFTLIIMAIWQSRADRRAQTSSTGAWALVGRSTVAAVLGGVVAVVLSPLSICIVWQFLG